MTAIDKTLDTDAQETGEVLGAPGQPTTPSPDERAVGYGNPPKAHRFQPGRSGNPKGRKQRAPTVAEQVGKLLGQKVKVTEGGKQKSLSIQEVMLRSIVKNAAKGDIKSAAFLLNLQSSHANSTSTSIEPERLNHDDKALLSGVY